MCRVRMFAVGLAVIGLSGCYHATVNTGIEPGARQVQQSWAKGFIYGLVPPNPLNVMDECDDAGVASVETQLSFLNQIVSFLTLGIFTPMEITVTCGDELNHERAQAQAAPKARHDRARQDRKDMEGAAIVGKPPEGP